MRQMHHWSAMLFIAAMLVHLMRVYFTGAFRKPRELNWVIGSLLLLLGTLEGFTGYSLPDDLLSGTGIRAADGFMKSMPGGRHVHVVLPVRRGVPGRLDHPAALHRARAADPGRAARADRCPHAAARLPQAHAVARARPHQRQRRRLPDAPGLRRQGRRVLLHRVRRHRPDGCVLVDQPGLALRPLQPLRGDGRLPARLVHGLARRRAPDHARVGDPPVRLHAELERLPADHRAARADVHDPADAARSWRPGSPATSATTTCSSGRATLRRAPR